MIKKHVIKSVVFLVTFAVLFCGVFKILWLQDNEQSATVFKQYYELPEKTVDAVYIGPSSVKYYWQAAEAFHNYGIAVYPLSTGGQPFSATKYIIREAQKTQNPSLFLVDIRMLAAVAPPMDAEVRRVSDSMNFSKNRFNAIDAMLQYETLESDNIKKIDYYFSFLKYHSRWKELTPFDFGDRSGFSMGFTFHEFVTPLTAPTEEQLNAQPVALSEYAASYLEDVLSFCKEENINVLFTNTPNTMEIDVFARLNQAKETIQQYGFPVLDLNFHTQAMGLNYSYDMREPNHVNPTGAQKFTNYLAKYLVENYSLPDHRGEKGYEAWVDAYEVLQKSMVQTSTNLYQYLNIIKNDRYSILVAVKDEASVSMNEDVAAQMLQLGLKVNLMGQVQRGYLAVIDKGKVVYEILSPDLQTPLSYSGALSDSTSFELFSSGLYAGNRASIMVNGLECAVNQRGLNFVVYDNEKKEVVDKVCFDSWAQGIPAYR